MAARLAGGGAWAALLPLLAGPGCLATSHVFDCEAGKSSWRTGWSKWKKEWCCERGGPEGCEDQEARFTFVGFGNALEARKACLQHGRNGAMPKTEGDMEAFRDVVEAAKQAGNLTTKWPRNTVWLGGKWDFDSRKWLWDDNTTIGKLLAARNHLDKFGESGIHKGKEPWLCSEVMSKGHWQSGHWQDSLGVHEFGIVCQRWEEVTTTSTSMRDTTSPSPKDVPTETFTRTNATETSVTVTTSFIQEEFDCREFVMHWEDAWTDAKKEYCCLAEGFGCVFQCDEGLHNWREGWSAEKKAWCCKLEQNRNVQDGTKRPTRSSSFTRWCCKTQEKGCAEDSTSPEAKEDDDAAEEAMSLPFNCSSGFNNWRDGWSAEKKEWCCTHQKKACEASSDPPSPSYDCTEGFANWQEGWSTDKKDWCCEEEHRGCEDEVMVRMLLEPHDCDAGFASRGDSWTVEKREWCCIYKQKGCLNEVLEEFSTLPARRPLAERAGVTPAALAAACAAAAAAALVAAGVWRRWAGRASSYAVRGQPATGESEVPLVASPLV